MKLSGKIFVYSMGITLIGFTIMASITTIYTRNIMKDQIGMGQVALVKNVLGEIDRILFHAYQNILLLSEEEAMEETLELSLQSKAGPNIDLYHILNEKFSLTGPWNSLTMIARQGIILESIGWEGTGKHISDYKVSDQIFQKALKSQTRQVSYSDLVFSDLVLSGPILSNQAGAPTIVFASPIFNDETREILGVIMAHFDWNAVIQLLETLHPRGMIHLFNQQGLVIATIGDHKDGILKHSFPGDLKTLEEGIFIIKPDHSASHGDAHMGATLAAAAIQKGHFGYKGSGWYLLVESHLDEIFEPINQMAVTIAQIAGIFIVILTGFSLYIGRHLARPVVLLTNAVGKVAKGDLKFRAEVSTKDEIGVLARAFNKMVEALDNITVSRDKLENAQESLKKSLQDLSHAQSQLVQSGKLASIGELAAGVAHELNQPLMVIRTTTQLSLRRLGKDSLNKNQPDINKLDDSFKSIEKNTKRMMNIINHLRTFSRQGEIQLSPLDVNKVIQNCFLMIREQLKLRDIVIKQDFFQGLPKVLGDTNQLEQVFLNLLSNARDAVVSRAEKENTEESTDFQGEIVITTKLLDQKEVQVLIKDNGSGIPLDKKDKIFDPFYTTKEVGKGTGLGLSISHGIIKDHKGEIDVAKTGSEGTTFRIRLAIA